MIGEGGLGLQEVMTKESLPLATIHDAILRFLRGRTDVALFGAQAVNAYVEPPRMTQDVDVFAVEAQKLAQELNDHLASLFGIAVRVRAMGNERGYRIYQLRKPSNRHLVDIRRVDVLPPVREMAGFQVVAPEELVAEKVIAFHRRRGQPKSGTDWRDLALLLLSFPELKNTYGSVRQRLVAASAETAVLSTWEEIVAQEILAEDDDDW